MGMHTSTEETSQIQSAIESAKLPGYVREVQSELGVDSTGAPAVWLYVIVTNKEAKSPEFGMHTMRIRDSLGDAIRDHGVDRWPYIRFRSVSEQKALALEAE